MLVGCLCFGALILRLPSHAHEAACSTTGPCLWAPWALRLLSLFLWLLCPALAWSGLNSAPERLRGQPLGPLYIYSSALSIGNPSAPAAAAAAAAALARGGLFGVQCLCPAERPPATTCTCKGSPGASRAPAALSVCDAAPFSGAVQSRSQQNSEGRGPCPRLALPTLGPAHACPCQRLGPPAWCNLDPQTEFHTWVLLHGAISTHRPSSEGLKRAAAPALAPQSIGSIMSALVPCLRLYAFLGCQLARAEPKAEHQYAGKPAVAARV
jgi:hypothetical protein